MTKKPKVGVGCYIFNEKGEVLLGYRTSKHGGGTWCPPGGHLENGEQPEETAMRETLEETGLRIHHVEELGFTNDIFDAENHYITLHFKTNSFQGTPQVMEPEKWERWDWFNLNTLPTPLFLSFEKAIHIWLLK